MKRIPLHKMKPRHWLLMAVIVVGGLGLETYLNVSGILAGPAYIHRPVETELAYYLAGGIYRVQLACRDRRKPRVHRLRADDHLEATAFLAERLPDCELLEIRRVRSRFVLLHGRPYRRSLSLF